MTEGKKEGISIHYEGTELKEGYKRRRRTLIEKGDAEEGTTPSVPGRTWYLPHFAVTQPSKLERLMRYSTLQQLMRCRQQHLAATADVEGTCFRIGSKHMSLYSGGARRRRRRRLPTASRLKGLANKKVLPTSIMPQRRGGYVETAYAPRGREVIRFVISSKLALIIVRRIRFNHARACSLTEYLLELCLYYL
ncbi:hypothetical protein EVAR_77550_1 [Eumeta japonica]|uniref:Uncharacterized protein n=1 Tax=Eumeta variegata TaxID=151549 RepID=A0A4C1T7F9_EUMVA|nr:hypothetical protein EVAR_77550_1 [Eumeta japonica]